MAAQPGGEDDLDAALDRACDLARHSGAEHWEVRAEAMREHAFEFDGAQVRNARTVLGLGVGLRVLQRGASGYGYTTELTTEAMREALQRALDLAAASHAPALRPAGKPGQVRDDPPARQHPREASFEDRLALVRRAHAAAAGAEVLHAAVQWGEVWGRRLVRTSDGGRADLAPLMTGMLVLAVTRNDHGGLASSLDYGGGARGLGDYDGALAPETLGTNAAKYAKEQARAAKAPAGRTRMLVDPVLAGVLAHESFGHLAEHDLVDAGWSVLQGREGQRLASDAVTIVDHGVLPGQQGVRVAADEEATPAREVALVERGVLKGFLHSRLTAGAAGTEPTGNARAVDYRFPPVCRMRNTYFQPGDLTVEEAMEEVHDGVYACGSTGGESRSDGNFLFALTRAYRIVDGEVGTPLKEASITGNILDFLRQVKGAADDLQVVTAVTGGCGKWGQWPLHVGYGGPHLVIEEALLGGQEAKRGP